ncbi:Autophagy-related protein 16 [Vitis vinifera]|uniref:Autophagy-related protein 16 n=1 Tax=Vitis vinifera TaxID=29760 RepID=A0A438CXB4_VITVI|nr:Autophagy-related protein 16 [Vitis vinifera]
MSRVVPFWDFFLMDTASATFPPMVLISRPNYLEIQNFCNLSITLNFGRRSFNIRKLLHPSKPKKIEAGEDIRPEMQGTAGSIEVDLQTSSCSMEKQVGKLGQQGVGCLRSHQFYIFSETSALPIRVGALSLPLFCVYSKGSSLNYILKSWSSISTSSRQRVGEMTDNSNMEGIQDDVKDPYSPPRKRIKTDDEASASQENAVNFSGSLVPTALKYKIHAHEAFFKASKAQFMILPSALTTASLLQLSHPKIVCMGIEYWSIRQTLTGHSQKVCAVDVGKVLSRYIVSAGSDQMIKVWDLQQDYPVCSRYISSACNAISFSSDETTICSGHANGKVIFSKVNRFWMNHSSEVGAHTQSVTSICPLQNGSLILSSGRDNWHNLIDTRTMQICSKFRTRCSRVASNWSRVCVSSDDNYAVVGSADGSVYVWSMQMGRMVNALKGHTAPVLACSWSGMGMPLASTDSDGTISALPGTSKLKAVTIPMDASPQLQLP